MLVLVLVMIPSLHRGEDKRGRGQAPGIVPTNGTLHTHCHVSLCWQKRGTHPIGCSILKGILGTRRGDHHRRERKPHPATTRIPARGIPTMDEPALRAYSSIVGMPLAGILVARRDGHFWPYVRAYGATLVVAFANPPRRSVLHCDRRMRSLNHLMIALNQTFICIMPGTHPRLV